jgi:hypothetical protein
MGSLELDVLYAIIAWLPPLSGKVRTAISYAKNIGTFT